MKLTEKYILLSLIFLIIFIKICFKDKNFYWSFSILGIMSILIAEREYLSKKLRYHSKHKHSNNYAAKTYIRHILLVLILMIFLINIFFTDKSFHFSLSILMLMFILILFGEDFLSY